MILDVSLGRAIDRFRIVKNYDYGIECHARSIHLLLFIRTCRRQSRCKRNTIFKKKNLSEIIYLRLFPIERSRELWIIQL